MLDCKKVYKHLSGYINSILYVYTDTCDPTWQSSRDGLIISAHVFSDISLLIFVAAGIYFAVDYISKRLSIKKRYICVYQMTSLIGGF